MMRHFQNIIFPTGRGKPAADRLLLYITGKEPGILSVKDLDQERGIIIILFFLIEGDQGGIYIDCGLPELHFLSGGYAHGLQVFLPDQSEQVFAFFLLSLIIRKIDDFRRNLIRDPGSAAHMVLVVMSDDHGIQTGDVSVLQFSDYFVGCLLITCIQKDMRVSR